MMKNDLIESTSISKIKIMRLFGKYSYVLPKKNMDSIEFSNVLILYGENGSGKTTILKLLFNLLSPKIETKSFIAKTPFKSLEVQFNNGIVFKIEKPEGSLTGSFSIRVYEEQSEKLSVFLTFNKEFEISTSYMRFKDRKNYQNLQKLIVYLSDLDLSVYFLTDNREFLQISDIYFEEISSYKYYIEPEEESRYYIPSEYTRKKIKRLIIRQALNRAERWLNLQITEALTKGEFDVNRIYSEIIESIGIYSEKNEKNEKHMNELVNTLEELAKRSEKYSIFKMITPLNISTIVRSINKTSLKNYRTIISILKPYIDGVKAKLDALEEIYNLLNLFTRSLNNFFLDKEVEFKLNEGILVVSDDIILKPEVLSSGEKQLLTLFCNTFPARDRPSIFIIDEPEISLNVKWQRQLIQALLDLTRGSQVQFILATHSIELLTQYSENVMDLISIE